MDKFVISEILNNCRIHLYDEYRNRTIFGYDEVDDLDIYTEIPDWHIEICDKDVEVILGNNVLPFQKGTTLDTFCKTIHQESMKLNLENKVWIGVRKLNEITYQILLD